jgi:FlaA1/EpsC-like NDP-sugar epimerase
VVGAGDAGAMILRDMLYRADSPYEPVGVVDDDPAKHGLRIHGVRVLGGRDRLAETIGRVWPDEVLIAIPSARLSTLRSIVQALQPYDLPIKTLPSIRELPECRVELTQIRPLAMEDLLTRPVVGLDGRAVDELIRGRRVLVTGAGGSIGSELCRQVLRSRPAELVLVERHENALFWLTNELMAAGPGATRVVPALVDITHAETVQRLLADVRPHIVFHAAAHKHVPLLEAQVGEAVRNNIFGTLTLARAAERFGVERFVLISTDKAVDPVSAMGATKRVCELIVQSLFRRSPTRFCAVRFGNVLGSNGSVALVFLRQIKAGGPVTVTDPEMRRYFMLISEAVELVTQAAAVAEPGTVYVLDMGEPIRILDMARQMIRLAGYRPDVDIPIHFTGLRPGERLEESLVDENERVLGCETRGLMRVVPDHSVAPEELSSALGHLWQAIHDPSRPVELSTLREIVSARRRPAPRSGRHGRHAQQLREEHVEVFGSQVGR